VHELYTRERVAILLLPDQPFSGQSKSDLTIELTRIQRNSKKNSFLKWYAWFWAVFTFASPVYILCVMDELDKNEDYYVNEFAEDTTRAWYVFALCAGLIPVFASVLTGFLCVAHRHQFVRGDAKFLAEGESKTGACWYEASSDDDEDFAYKPPSMPKGSDSANNQNAQ
jgi:hypothetical protein